MVSSLVMACGSRLMTQSVKTQLYYVDIIATYNWMQQINKSNLCRLLTIILLKNEHS